MWGKNNQIDRWTSAPGALLEGNEAWSEINNNNLDRWDLRVSAAPRARQHSPQSNKASSFFFSPDLLHAIPDPAFFLLRLFFVFPRIYGSLFQGGNARGCQSWRGRRRSVGIYKEGEWGRERESRERERWRGAARAIIMSEIIAFGGQNWGGTKDQQNQQKWRGLLWATR